MSIKGLDKPWSTNFISENITKLTTSTSSKIIYDFPN